MQEEVNQKTVALSIRTAAFQKYSAKVLNKEQDKASILGQLRKFTEQIRTQAKEKQRTREAVKDGR